jgi:hypothetical protein
LLTVLLFLPAQGQNGESASISLPTDLRVRQPGWWPSKGDLASSEYVGTKECTSCHFAIANIYRETAMAQAAVLAANSSVLRAHEVLSFQQGPYNYQLSTENGGSILSATDRISSVSGELLWGVGIGHMGQTYIYKRNGDFYESRLSFFSQIQGLDITPGHSRSVPGTLVEALGLQQPQSEIERCLGCHTTQSKVENRFDAEHAVPGVTCEACHGPGKSHVTAVKAGKADARELIFNPRRLNPVDAVDFCGACHRTWQDVVGRGLIGVGVFNVRFAPYRLENSRCWKQQDTRIVCTSCHDPHKPLVQESGDYDARCLSCHILRGQKKEAGKIATACPVNKKDCVSCHMPKYKPPSLHSSFTDHWIRIVRPGKPYPN